MGIAPSILTLVINTRVDYNLALKLVKVKL